MDWFYLSLGSGPNIGHLQPKMCPAGLYIVAGIAKLLLVGPVFFFCCTFHLGDIKVRSAKTDGGRSRENTLVFGSPL